MPHANSRHIPWYRLPATDRFVLAAEATASGLAFTVRLSNDVAGRASAASKTVTTYLSNRLADHLRGEGLTGLWLWFVIETLGEGLEGLHLHGGATVDGRAVPAFRRALRRLAGEFGGAAERYKIKIHGYDPRKRFAGRHGAAGWAAYATKDYANEAGLARAERRFGCPPVYVSHPLRRHARAVHEAAGRSSRVCRAAAPPSACRGPERPSWRSTA